MNSEYAMDAFSVQQRVAYRAGRKAQATGFPLRANPNPTFSNKWEAWRNGWLDASQGIGSQGLQIQKGVN